MVLEQFVVKVFPGKEREFELAMEHGMRTVMARAKGMRAWSLRRCVEMPDHYQVQQRWDSIDDHLIGYRNGPLAAEFRAIVTPFYDGWPNVKPEVRHYNELTNG